MHRWKILVGLVGGIGLSTAQAWAQCGCELPGVSPPPMAPTVSYLPPVEPVPTPVVVYRPVTAPVVVSPVVTPVVVYRPVVSPAPVVVYRPVVASEVVAAVPVVGGRPAIIRTKVYYPGEPIRNLLKALAP